MVFIGVAPCRYAEWSHLKSLLRTEVQPICQRRRRLGERHRARGSGTVYSFDGMHLILRLTSLFLSLCVLPVGPARAQTQPLQRIDMAQVVACPARAGDTTPPDFAGPGCRSTPFPAVNPQHTHLWLRASIVVPPAMLEQAEPPGLFVSAKAASTAWVNGHRIGSNGQPGIDAAHETPGRMDADLPIPRGLLKPGANEIVLNLSAHHGFLHLDNPMHLLAIGVYADPTDQILRGYWPSLI
ncbi:MAG TPA: hypothetical protein VGC74_12840, partial [Stenotrophomonas sp.]